MILFILIGRGEPSVEGNVRNRCAVREIDGKEASYAG